MKNNQTSVGKILKLGVGLLALTFPQAQASKLVFFNQDATTYVASPSMTSSHYAANKAVTQNSDKSISFEISLLETIKVLHDQGHSNMGRIRLQGSDLDLGMFHLLGDIHLFFAQSGEMELLKQLYDLHGKDFDLVVDLLEYGKSLKFGGVLGLGHNGIRSLEYRIRWNAGQNRGKFSKPMNKLRLASILKHHGITSLVEDKAFQPLQMTLAPDGTHQLAFWKGLKFYHYSFKTIHQDGQPMVEYTVKTPGSSSTRSFKAY